MKKALLLPFLFFAAVADSQPISIHMREDRSIIFTGPDRELLRVTPYGDYMLRIQVARVDEDFFADGRYEMIENHNWPGNLSLKQAGNIFQMESGKKDGMILQMDRATSKLTFSSALTKAVFLHQRNATAWDADTIRSAFEFQKDEHFSALGHGYYGREESIDIKGKSITRNYGTEHGQQAPLLVPFYISSKGYGVFLNSTFPNRFNFGSDGKYEFSIYGDGRMDYFVIFGPDFSDILDRYTQLTGRPFLPPKAFFGLALSDKGHDHTSRDPSDEKWWRRKISQHRAAGFPLDHIVNDNRWRAGGGQRCISHFEWDKERYPMPSEYAAWVKANGLITTLDLNRCIAARSEGWKPSFNIPDATGIDFNTSAPDLTNREVRNWFWNLMWSKSLDPKLGYPGNALWIDEFDEMGKASPNMVMHDGRTWMEMRNYWFFLVAKSLVADGWNKSFAGLKRPFVWVRGMTAGAQRYATMWSGDIKPLYTDMKTQVRSMQLAGLSGFPFWGHDAGGFYEYDLKRGPTDSMYMQWSMAFGSFTPFWKPHGVGQSRWPLDRSSEVQSHAKVFCSLRYRLIPYIYSYAHIANATGKPIARAMILDHQNEPEAWRHDLQYMWGDQMLVAPNCSDTAASVAVWLPRGIWYDLWNDDKLRGSQVISYPSPLGKLPVFVKAGAVIPMAPYVLSTAFIPSDSLSLHVYSGADGKFILFEDDATSEAYRLRNEKAVTAISFKNSDLTLNIGAVAGSYHNAPVSKVYSIHFHGLTKPPVFSANVKINKSQWDEQSKVLTIELERTPTSKAIVLKGS